MCVCTHVYIYIYLYLYVYVHFWPFEGPMQKKGSIFVMSVEVRSYIWFLDNTKKRKKNVKENGFLIFGFTIENMKKKIMVKPNMRKPFSLTFFFLSLIFLENQTQP